ncbi:MAG TPA: chitobiase/beta-hexosaminidase C-terminal domain-containing protein, partial [Vicinamibacterales bacterium]|nr:chitobiase/beta-hexosaminidase C-terminal domain-containing protein [Vicinamibacterales bacterium]
MSSSAAAIAAGARHSVFVKTDGTVYATGNNSYGQLGDASTTGRTSPVQMASIGNATAAAAGANHTLVLLGDGTVKAAGYNVDGELGDGTWTSRTTAVAVSNLTAVTKISAGAYHSLALKSDGTMRVWGWNAAGQQGQGNYSNNSTPASVPGLTSITAIAGGAEHSLAVTADGVVYGWGRNHHYQVGDGTMVNRPSPVAISEAGYDFKLATPELSVAAGTYNTDRTVTVTITAAGAAMYFTRNGAEPTTSDSAVASGGTISITYSQTLKVKAFKSGLPNSNTASATYEMKVGTVNFSPAPSTYTTPKTVTMSTATPGATIRYTTDGSAPTSSSSAYTGPITIATSTVLKATGFKTDWSNSAEASGTYTMNFGTLAAPSADQATGSYVHSVTVSLSSIAGATIRYTSDNSSVQVNSPIYTAALVFDVTTTLRFKGYHPDYQPSPEVTRVYTLSPAAPVFDPGGGSYPGGQVVTITGMTSGATMRYTINGVEPTAADQPIASGASLVVGNYTLKAKAFKSGTTPSATTSATYLVSGSVSAPVLAAGVDYSLAIRSDGTAWGWGQNVSGQTGAGNTTSPQRLPKIINGVTGAAAISGGTEHTQIVTTSGNVAGFGGNGNGRIGDGTTTARLLPTAVTGVSSIVGIAAGHGHTVALKGDGTVSAWGANTDGQVGDGTTTDRVSPTSVSGLSSVVEVSAGSSFSLARKQNGTVVSWGRNYYGQLGNGNNTGSSLPVSVSTISTATGISAGWLHALALLADGTVRAWGYNYYGQLGDGTTTHRNAPVEVAGLDDVVVVRAGTGFSLALKADGTVWAWGENNYGQLGDGTTTPHSSPAQVSDLTGIVAIAAGSSHALAMSSDGTVYAWGRNASGQLGDGTTTQKLTPFQISGAGMTWRVPAPTLSLASGLFYANQTVTVTSLDPSATLRYTTTGVDPTSSDATVTSGGTISITQSQTLKVNAWRTGAVTSLVVSGVYELKAVVPTLTPGAGAYGTAQNVSMATTTSGATPRYTTDGTEPTESSTAYSSAIVVANPLTVKVRAYKAGWTPSDSGYASYVISGGTVATPVITPAGGAQSVPPLVAMTSTTTGATIRYTVDGSTPTATSAVFVYPFLLTSTTTVKAKAFKAGYTASATASTTFNVDAAGAAATPQISPAGGWFATQQIVTITGATGQTLRYTTDGSDPTTSSTLIASGGTISVDKSQVLKVRAWESSLAPSAIRRGDFIVTGAVAAGVSHSVALASNGAVWTWGSNFNGQLGAGSSYTGSVVPVQVLTAVMAINAGAHHTLAVKTDGTVWTWGSGGYGALGNGHTGTTGTFWTPSQIAFTGGIAVAGGMAHSLVLKADGTVWAFGKNEYGELGDGTTTMRATPVQVVGLTGIVAIAASRGSSYALQSDGGSGGILWAWGANHYGQLGD